MSWNPLVKSNANADTMTTTTITRRIELAHRASNGVDVYLFWNEPTSRVTVGVIDARR